MRYLLPRRGKPTLDQRLELGQRVTLKLRAGAPGCCPYGKARTVSLNTRGDLGFEGRSRRV
jgi:hypothetical protein